MRSTIILHSQYVKDNLSPLYDIVYDNGAGFVSQNGTEGSAWQLLVQIYKGTQLNHKKMMVVVIHWTYNEKGCA